MPDPQSGSKRTTSHRTPFDDRVAVGDIRRINPCLNGHSFAQANIQTGGGRHPHKAFGPSK